MYSESFCFWRLSSSAHCQPTLSVLKNAVHEVNKLDTTVTVNLQYSCSGDFRFWPSAKNHLGHLVHPLPARSCAKFSEDFRLVSEIHSRQRLYSASSTDVVVPATHRSSLGDGTFPVAGAQAWNALPRHLRAVSLFIPATSDFFFCFSHNCTDNINY